MEIPVLNEIMRDTVVEVDLDRIAFNVRQIKAMAGPGTQVAAVVKADGYGHGALGIAPAIMENGASLLAVATLSEAVELKQAYPGYPVLIMGLTPDRLLPYVLEYGIIQTIDTLAQARLLNRLASEKKQQAVIHIKYDTGFHRIGFPDCPKSLDEIRQICSMPWLKPEGIYSHLALKDDQSNQVQFRCFMDAVNELEGQGCHFRYKHIADSIAAVDFPEYRLDMIRAGAIVYGLKGFHKGQLDIRQALTFKTRISHITPVLKGQGVPVIGVICMDQCMIDLTDVPEAQIGDQVIIYGDGSGNTLDIDAVSRLAGTNKNEIVARLTRRPPRIYVRGNDSGTGYSSAERMTP